jgi:hypothetical protein
VSEFSLYHDEKKLDFDDMMMMMMISFCDTPRTLFVGFL